VQATSHGVEPSLDLPAEVRIVRTPRSGARFWDLGDFAVQQEEARRLTTAALDGWTP
jgi:hypothetical protein